MKDDVMWELLVERNFWREATFDLLRLVENKKSMIDALAVALKKTIEICSDPKVRADVEDGLRTTTFYPTPDVCLDWDEFTDSIVTQELQNDQIVERLKSFGHEG
jgi:hypothetical protein